MKLEGNLQMFPLRELIEMTVYSSVIGALNIFGTQCQGQLFFHDGRLYHAMCGSKEAMEAVVALFEETDATFTFTTDVTAEAETIFGDALDLIDTAEQHAARWRRTRKFVPSTNCVPHLLCPPERARYSISPVHWPIFTSIDGHRSIEDIIQEINITPLEVCEAIAQMCRDQLTELRRPQFTAFASQSEPASPPKTNVFDRLLTKPGQDNNAPTPAPASAAVMSQTPVPPLPQEEDPILRLLRS